MAVFVLVHGAWHGGWCWRRVADILRARGHHVTTPTMTGLGERAHLLSSEITLTTFGEDLRLHLEFEDLRDVVLVGHSFAGSPISYAAETARDRIARLVYLDATLAQGGETPLSVMAPEVIAHWPLCPLVQCANELTNEVKTYALVQRKTELSTGVCVRVKSWDTSLATC